MESLRIMTFNIRGANFPDGVNDWKHRSGLNVELLHRHAPDLIGFQELQQEQIKVYEQELTDYAVEFGPETAVENRYGGYFCAIYWRADRFERVDSGHFFLSETPNVYSLDWGTVQARAVNWVRLHDRHTGLDFIHANSHFPHDSEEARIRGAHLTVEQLQHISAGQHPVLITADFNARSTVFPSDGWMALTPQQAAFVNDHVHMFAYRNNVYEVFTRAGYADTFTQAGEVDAPAVNTGHVYLGQDCPPVNFRIDWILSLVNQSRIDTHRCLVITDEAPPLYPSDHYPVLAELTIHPA
jgi:endonuclease/exonuclease/phosphatase family metal-dependent hydrolase